MTTIVLLIVIVLLVAFNIVLWKSGSIHDSEHPTLVDDRPVMNPRQRKAIMERLDRWKEEGKLTDDEHEKFNRLCEENWG